jgi:hypothetical protein
LYTLPDKNRTCSNSDYYADYVNIDTILSSDHQNSASASGETNQPIEAHKKSFSDNDDTFSVDTDNTSNDSH